jgi:hypothetical protein
MTELSREEWLAKRRNYLGASEVAAVLGEDPRRGKMANAAADQAAKRRIDKTNSVRRIAETYPQLYRPVRFRGTRKRKTKERVENEF